MTNRHRAILLHFLASGGEGDVDEIYDVTLNMPDDGSGYDLHVLGTVRAHAAAMVRNGLLEWVSPGTGDREYGSGGRVRLTAKGRKEAELAAAAKAQAGK